MANYVIRHADDPLNPLEHSKKIFREALKLFTLKDLSGKGASTAVIVMDTTLRGKHGDTVRHHFIPKTQHKPLRGQNIKILGNESGVDEYYLDVKVNEMNYAYAKRGKMTDQRLIWNARSEFSSQIRDDLAQYNEDVIFKVGSGIDYEEDDETVWESDTQTVDRVSGANRIIRAKGTKGFQTLTAAQSNNASLVSLMSTSDRMSPTLIRRAATMVRTANSKNNDKVGTATNTYKMAPFRYTKGKNMLNREWFFLFCSLEAANDLAENPAWISWQQSQNGRLPESAEEMGAVGVYANVIVVPSERIIHFHDASGNRFARNLLMGANSVFCGWASLADYTEEWQDHKRELSMNVNEIRGEKKITFNGCDLGIAQVITASNL